MNTSDKKMIQELATIGSGVRSHRVTGSTRSETKNNVTRVFENARRRIEKERRFV